MVKLNHHYQKLSSSYLFSEIEKRIAALKNKQPDVPLISLGIGDVSKPICPAIVSALIAASQEMGEKKTFRGYGPCEGYLFLRQAIAENDYKHLDIQPDEVFISDGANSDIANLQEIFAIDNRIAIPDPTYPVYLDTNVMAGRTRLPLKTGRYGGITYLPCTEANGFQAEPPDSHADLIYLCSPNNPTGTAIDRTLMKRWVDYAREHQAVILLDGAYEAYISSTNAPHSIYEIEGAKEVAIEVRSFSKWAGFTGLRCSYTVIPHQLRVQDAGAIHSLNSLWRRRVETKSNGVAYPIQRAALAVYSHQGQKEIQELIQTYSDRARFLREGLKHLGYTVYGGVDAPYLWCKTPGNMGSWEFFDLLLEKAHIVAIPGRGFGLSGEGFIRFSAFAEPTSLAEGLLRLKNI
jgi:LL-diaminopimelate aminotransferase